MMVNAILGFCTMIGVMCLIIWRLKSQKDHLTVEKMLLERRLNATQTELNNVRLAKKTTENNRSLSNDDVDQFLQDGGFFRPE